MTPHDRPPHEGAAPAALERARQLGLVTERLPETIDRDTYTPALLALLSNVLVWGGSRVFRSMHDVGTNEWRIISALGNYPGATATDLCEILGLNKSIASKSVNVLLERKFVAQLDGPRGSRFLYLTPAGRTVHDDFMPIAMKRQQILHENLSAEEVAQLNSLLVRMLGSSTSMQTYEREIVGGSSDTQVRRRGSKGVAGT